MRILLACDKFKGSLGAAEACAAIQAGLSSRMPGAAFDLCPIADGGEGTTEAMLAALGGEWRETRVADARGRPVVARHGWIPGPGLAVLEMSAASGLWRVADLPLEPARASTRGTGELLLAAARDAREVILGIGGSATNDGGLGLAEALGWRLLDRHGRAVAPGLEHVLEAARLEAPERGLPPIRVACDVDNPLLGPRGATRVYGPQKGVAEPVWFERRLGHLADLAERHLGRQLRELPGAGAAGGLGFGLMAFAGGRLVPGFGLVAEALGLKGRIQAADLVVTGEGRLDAQSLQGKGPGGVARLARAAGKPVVAFAGGVEPEAAAPFDLAVAIAPGGMAREEAMRRGRTLLTEAADRHADALRRLILRAG